MRLERQAQRLVVVDDVLGQRHLGELHDRLVGSLARLGPREQRQRLGGAQRLTSHSAWRRSRPMERKASAAASFSSVSRSRARAHRSCTSRNVVRTVPDESRLHEARGDELLDFLFLQAVDLAQAEAQRRAAVGAARFQRAVPVGEVDVGGAHLDAVLARIAHDLRRRIEAHRLRVQQRRRERRRVMALDPGRDVDEMREARRVALGEAVLAEALDLVEAALGEVAVVAARDHARDHLLLEEPMVPRRRKVAIALRSSLTSASENFAATMAMRIACSWNSGTPIVLPRMWRNSSVGPCSGAGEG